MGIGNRAVSFGACLVCSLMLASALYGGGNWFPMWLAAMAILGFGLGSTRWRE